ncbi:hypothetical protein [Delftia acidovorans]|uniref:hypothetical protein n=1 Tax=Delftia acidovorans TaxID=80866 RepID=UPI0012FD3542|nr:hypothetical protein [Delftia acidovorans]
MSQREIVNCACPLCGAGAAYYEIDYGERHYYKCPTCTKFIITYMAEKRIRQSGSTPSGFSGTAAAATKDDDRVLEICYSHGGSAPAGFSIKVVNKADYRSI